LIIFYITRTVYSSKANVLLFFRSTIINLFRVPLNILTVTVLLLVKSGKRKSAKRNFTLTTILNVVLFLRSGGPTSGISADLCSAAGGFPPRIQTTKVCWSNKLRVPSRQGQLVELCTIVPHTLSPWLIHPYASGPSDTQNSCLGTQMYALKIWENENVGNNRKKSPKLRTLPGIHFVLLYIVLYIIISDHFLMFLCDMYNICKPIHIYFLTTIFLKYAAGTY
jgi:hypothetical protein